MGKINYYNLNQLASQDNLIEYKNVDFGFSIKFPKNWVQTINQSSYLLATPFFNEDSHEIIDYSISVTIHKNNKQISNNQSLEIYTKGMIEYAENIIEVKDTIFNSLKAKKIIFTHNEFRRSYLNTTYIFINDEGIWGVTAKSLERNSEIHITNFNEIINTFKFIKPAY